MDLIKILLVEDEKKIADSLKKGLTEQNYQVQVAYDGLEGRRLFENEQFDLIILDINLPGMSGITLCKKIRNRNPSIPIVMLTALSATDDKIEGFDAGADDYIVKPFDFKELLVRIKALLKRIYQWATLSSTSTVRRYLAAAMEFLSRRKSSSCSNTWSGTGTKWFQEPTSL